MLPILEYSAGRYMAESMDIVRYLDSQPEYGAPIVKSGTNAPITQYG
jgi:glutaredoxin 2